MSYRTAEVMTTHLSSKGQVVLPRAVRDAHRWAPGTELVVEDSAGGVFLRPVKSTPATSLEAVIGSAGYAGPTRTVAEMEQAIGRGARARRDRR